MFRLSIPSDWIAVSIESKLYNVRIPSVEFQQLLEQYRSWCRRQIGSSGTYWIYDPHRDIEYFYFDRQEDAVAFRLTFGL